MKLSPRVKQNLRKILPKSLIVFRAELKRRKINLEDFSKSTIAEVKINAEKICGSEADGSKPGWNYYSDALLPEVIQTFESAILALNSQFTKVNYLEIGSNQGLSMSAISLMLKSQGILGELVSVDPYFEEGYKEGNLTPELGTYKVNINKSTKELAFKLYQTLGINVELLETISADGLKSLIESKRKFHLIYIDGSHENLNPIIDFGLSSALLYPNGIIMLDDYQWPDVISLKELCDKYCVKVHECWKVAAYKISS